MRKLKQTKTPIRQFDDLDMELIECLIRTFSAILEIKGNVVCLSKDQMMSIYFHHATKAEKKKEEDEFSEIYGSCYWEDKIIFLNPKYTRRIYQSLIDTIIHELLHIKFPKKTEDQILNLERKYTGRFDYVLKSDMPTMKKCKVMKFA